MSANHRPKFSYLHSLIKRCWLVAVMVGLMAGTPLHADTRVILRVLGGLPVAQTICNLLGCSVLYGLGDDAGQVFLISTPPLLSLQLILSVPGVLDAEVDMVAQTKDPAPSGGPVAPQALYDSTKINYYGTNVRHGYVYQPATQIIGLQNTQSTFGVKGSGIVAVIDTGVDPNHPVLQGVLLPGYDFTRNQAGANEMGDVTQSTTAVVDQSTTAVVDQSTTAVVDSNTAKILNQQKYQAFGHGTMVAGVVHLVAPGAKILPLKAFHVDGTGYTSDVIRAINYAVGQNARILNMSFSFTASSKELSYALNSATAKGVIAVSAAGNDGRQTLVYPAAYSNVMGVASTSNNDTQSWFTNYGQNLVWLSAPGEAVVTLYPYGTYAATWGTSFSTPMAAGAAALLLDIQSNCSESQAAQALAHGVFINTGLGTGRLDLYGTVQAWVNAQGWY